MEDGIPNAAKPRLKLNTPSPWYHCPVPVSHADNTMSFANGFFSLKSSDKRNTEYANNISGSPAVPLSDACVYNWITWYAGKSCRKLFLDAALKAMQFVLRKFDLNISKETSLPVNDGMLNFCSKCTGAIPRKLFMPDPAVLPKSIISKRAECA